MRDTPNRLIITINPLKGVALDCEEGIQAERRRTKTDEVAERRLRDDNEV